MDYLARKRIHQFFQYGWPQSKEIAKTLEGVSRITVFLDMFRAFREYHLWSHQYKKEGFFMLSEDARREIGAKYKVANDTYDNWGRDKVANRAFLYKYTTRKWDLKPKWFDERNEAYRKRYNMGEGCDISTNVVLERNHFLNGTVKMGKNVMLSKNVFIDYSGELIIQDDVAIANGVIIETHTHLIEKKGAPPAPGRLEIEKGVKVLSRAYIADTCHFIGRYARIGAGAYVRNNVLPYSIMIGNPAKIVGFMYSPDEMVEFEKNVFPENERTDVEKYRQDYKKYFIDRRKEIKSFLQK